MKFKSGTDYHDHDDDESAFLQEINILQTLKVICLPYLRLRASSGTVNKTTLPPV